MELAGLEVLHMFPHPPQLLESELVSRQVPPQIVSPAQQSACTPARSPAGTQPVHRPVV